MVVFEAFPPTVLIVEGGAHPTQANLAAPRRGRAMVGVVEDLKEIALVDGGMGVVVYRGIHDGLHLGSHEEEVGG